MYEIFNHLLSQLEKCFSVSKLSKYRFRTMKIKLMKEFKLKILIRISKRNNKINHKNSLTKKSNL